MPEPTTSRDAGKRVPDMTLDTLARGFFREAEQYGFGHADYLRFVNRLLDMSMGAKGGFPSTSEKAAPYAGALPLQGERVQIRRFDRQRDLAFFERWMQDPMGRYFLLARTLSRTVTLEDVVDDPASVIGVVTLRDGTPIGSTAFLQVDLEQGKAELRKVIGEAPMRGRGLAKEASKLWIAYGLGGLALHKIYLNTLNTQLRNIRLNEALGFRVEGILHNEVLLDGRYYDVLRMALWRETPRETSHSHPERAAGHDRQASSNIPPR